MKIYFLHDDQEDPSTKIKFLEIAGFEVVVMQDARKCLAMLENHAPDLIISDILIHGMTGFEFCLAVRQRFSPDRVPVLLCSGIYKGSTFQEEAIRIGAQEYLLSPIPLDALIGSVHKALMPQGDSEAA
jgi:PleD family two-component response regulator